ncbi:MAG TPA: helix-turn-helix domain-containing protein [Anaerolineales bacterium]|nr:helix-turn-helix domain-containing protein [Anaerolineales bacterium]HLA81330.1 helix-turn-helix domain-containing protein [Thermoleophilia bacterium]
MKEHLPAVKTIQGVAASLRLSLSAARKRAEKGKIRGQKVGRRRRFRKESIEKWLSRVRAVSMGEGGTTSSEFVSSDPESP